MQFDSSRDQEFVEDANTIQWKLLNLAIVAGSGGAAFAVNHWMFGNTGFRWIPCLLAAGCGAFVVAWFSRKEKLPIPLGLVAGLIAGAGSYLASVGYVSMRTNVRFAEMVIPAVFGSFPGLVTYFVSVRIYYWLTDSDK
jgi:hypothetical protein